jgi:hypothetical protein
MDSQTESEERLLGSAVGFTFIAGVINTEDTDRFKRMTFRATRGVFFISKI